MIRESANPQTGKAGVRDVEAQILDAIRKQPGLTDEQRARCVEAASGAYRDYIRQNGLQGGLPTDPSALGLHAAAIRGVVTSGLTDVLMHHPELDPKAFCDIVHQIEQTCDAAAGTGSLDSRHVKAAFDAEKAMLAEHGLDASGMDFDASMAEMARAMLDDAKAVFDDPAKATAADLEMIRQMSAVADTTYDAIEEKRLNGRDVSSRPQAGVERTAGPDGLVDRSTLRTVSEEPTLPAPR